MNNQERKVRPEIININGNEPVFYPFSIKTSKLCGSCNNINDPYAKTCKCKCRLDASVCNNKQPWDDDKCRCDCK